MQRWKFKTCSFSYVACKIVHNLRRDVIGSDDTAEVSVCDMYIIVFYDR